MKISTSRCWRECQNFPSWFSLFSSILSDLNIIAVILVDPLFCSIVSAREEMLFVYITYCNICELKVEWRWQQNKMTTTNMLLSIKTKWVSERFWCVDLLHILMSSIFFISWYLFNANSIKFNLQFTMKRAF